MRKIGGLIAVLAAVSLYGQSITTVAGGGTDDGQRATAIPVAAPRGLAVDRNGNIYFASSGSVRRIDASTGTVKRIAGTGAAGFSGDGGLAINAVLNDPRGITFDTAGNLYIADSANDRVRRVDAQAGVITTFAGGGNPPSGIGDGAQPTSAILRGPTGVAFDRGFLYITEAGFDGNRIRRITLANNIIETIAGSATGESGFAGDGAAASSAKLSTPYGIAVDAAGNIFFADLGNNRVRRIDAQTKNIETYAAQLAVPSGVGFDPAGNLLVSCIDSGSLVKIDKTTKIITTFSQTVYLPTFVTSDATSVIWSSDDGVVYRVAADGTRTTLAGGGTFIGDGRVATAAVLEDPEGIAILANGDLLIADTGHNVLRRVTSDGRISTVAGKVGQVYVDNQEGVNAADAVIGFPRDVKLDSAGAIYISDLNNGRIFRIDSSNKVSTYAKDIEAWAMAFDASDNLYFVGQNRVFRIDRATKAISVVAGTGDYDFSGDGGPATQAKFRAPRGLALDNDGNIFVADEGNGRIRRIDRGDGTVNTVAGGGQNGIGDDGPATGAQMQPVRLAISKKNGDLYIADAAFHRMRRIDAATRTITTVAGSSNFYTEGDFAGDGGRATAAKLNLGTPSVALSSTGDLYIADSINNRIRAVFACAQVATPVLARPADNAANVSTAPTLSWSDTFNAFRYDVLLDTVSPPVKVAASDVSETSFTPANLQPSTKYFWRVVAKGDSFCSPVSTASSAIASFTTSGACAASAFEAIAPANGAQVAEPSVLLTWNASAGAATYDVFFSAFSAPTRVATGLTETSFRVSALAGTYTWFIVAHAACDPTQTTQTTPRTFTSTAGADCPQQSIVTLNSPANGATAVSQSPNLVWSLNGFATSYDLYLGKTADPPLYAANIVDTHQAVSGLDSATKYFWRVVARTPCAQAPVSSQTFSFTTQECVAPGTPSIVFAPPTVNAGSTYSIVWSPAPGLDANGAYLLERSTSQGFESILDSQVSSSTAASFLATSIGPLFHRVRAISACDASKVSAPSAVVRVNVVAAPPNIVFTVQPAATIVELGSKLEDATNSFTLENIGATAVQIIVGRQELGGAPPFFSIIDPEGNDAAFITLDPHKPHTFNLRFSGPPNNIAASYQGVVFAASTGTGLAVTPYAFVNLKVGGTLSAAPLFIVDGSPSEYASFPAFNGDDANRPPIQIGVRNNGSSAVDVGFEIGPELWLTADPTWNSTRIEPQTTRTVSLSTKRSRAPNGSALPRYTYFTVRTRDGAASRLLVQDNGDVSVTSGRTARLDAATRSFIVPEVVSRVGPRGVLATRLRLSNIGSDPVQTQLIFTPANADGFDATAVRTATVVVPPNDVVTLTDPLIQVFKLSRPASGQVEVRLPPERVGLISVSATTVSFNGSASIPVPVVNRGEGARSGSPQIVSGITKSSSLTTALVLAETTGNDHASIRATLRDVAGNKIGELTADVPRYGVVRFDDVVATAGAQAATQASLEIAVQSGGGVVSGTAIVTASGSDSGTAIPSRAQVDASSASALSRLLSDAQPSDTPSQSLTTIVPLVGTPSSSGTAPTYKTLVGFAAGSTAANFVASLHLTSTSIKQTITVPANTTRVFNDVVGELFALPSVAKDSSVIVQAPSTSRVYAMLQPTGGSGAATLPPAIIQLPTSFSEALTSAAASSQRPLFADGLEQSTDSTRGSRWLLLLNEVAGSSGVVNVRLYEAANRTVPIAEKDVSISASQQLQLDTVFSELGLDAPDRRKDRTNVQCVVTAKSGAARVSASAVGIDNATGATQVIALVPSVGSATPSVSLVTPVLPSSQPPASRRRAVKH